MNKKEIHRHARILASNGLSKFRTWKRTIRKSLRQIGAEATRADIAQILTDRTHEGTYAAPQHQIEGTQANFDRYIAGDR